MTLTKHILFYSNFCSFSRETLDFVNKRDLRGAFNLMCVDNPAVSSKLPSFVDRVPLVVAPDRKCYADAELSDLLDRMANGGGSGDVQAFFGQATSYSDGFAFIKDESVSAAAGDDDEGGMLPTHYVRFGADDQLTIPTPSDEQYGSRCSSNGGSGKGQQLENIMSQREADLMSIQRQQPQPI